jgi:GTPase-activating protein SAC7
VCNSKTTVRSTDRCGPLKLTQRSAAGDVKDVFVNSGHPGRVLALQEIFDSPDRRYGKSIDWAGFTIHDCAALLLRYLKSLPEPQIPFDLYYQFTEPFRKYPEKTWKLSGDCWPDLSDNYQKTPQQAVLVKHCKEEIFALPPLNRQLLLYILDIFAFMAGGKNNMPVDRLVSVFHPAVLSARPQEMTEAEHQVSRDTLVFLAHWQDEFLEAIIEQSCWIRQS